MGQSRGAGRSIYEGDWEPSFSPATLSFDPWRWSGRQDRYTGAELAAVLADPTSYYDRRLAFNAFLLPSVGAPTLLGTPSEPRGITGVILQEAHTSPGSIVEGNGLRRGGSTADADFDGDLAGWGVACWGIVDCTPVLQALPGGAGVPLCEARLSHITHGKYEDLLRAPVSGYPGSQGTPGAVHPLEGAPPDFAACGGMAGSRGVSLLISELERRLGEPRPDAPEAEKQDLFHLGWLHEQGSGDLWRASGCYRRVWHEYAAVPGYQGLGGYRYGRCLEALEKPDAAVAVYLQLVQTWPWDFWVTAAAARLTCLGAEDAVQLPISPEAAELIGSALRLANAGKPGPSLALFQQVLQVAPKDAWSRLHAAAQALLLNDVPRAQEHVRRFLTDAPHWKRLAELFFSMELSGTSDFPFARRTEECQRLARASPGWAVSDQYLFADLRERSAEFPEDFLPHLLRARLWQDCSARRGGFKHPGDGSEAMRRARALASGNWWVRLHHLQFLTKLPVEAMDDLAAHGHELREAAGTLSQWRNAGPQGDRHSAPPTAGTVWQNGPVRIARFLHLVQSREESEVEASLPPTADRLSSPEVLWRAPLLSVTGYADEARSFLLPLQSRLCSLRAEGMESVPEQVALSPTDRDAVERLLQRKISHPYVEVVQNPPDVFQRNELAWYRIGRTMFEFVGLPPSWVGECNAMDEIWIPSTFCRDLFAESGVAEQKLHLVPGAVDTRKFCPDGNAERWKCAASRERTRFLGVFTFVRRKGWDRLLEAYVREFTGDDPVELVLRTAHPHEPLTAVAERIVSFLDQLGLSLERMPPVALIEDRSLSGRQMRDLYRSADVVVLPSRGEGYGRPLLEALACGVPVITTGWGGQTDFVTEENGWLVNYHLTLTGPTENPLFRGLLCAEPSLDHLRACLREAFDEGALRRRKGAAGPASVARFDQEEVADGIAARFQTIQAERGQGGVAGWSRRLQARKADASSTAQCQGKSVLRPWILLVSPQERCPLRMAAEQLLRAGLEQHVTRLSYTVPLNVSDLPLELLHVHYGSDYIAPKDLARHPKNGKWVATVHDLLRFEEVSRLFDGIIVQNERDRQAVLRMDLHPASEVTMIPPGCFTPADGRDRPSGRVDPVVAHYGFLGGGQGLSVLLQAFGQFREFHPGSRLLVLSTLNAYAEPAGQVTLEECRSLVGALGLAESVALVTEFLPLEAVLTRLRDEADMMVLPFQSSEDGGAAETLRVAMAAGKPVLTTALREFAELQEAVLQFGNDPHPQLAQRMREVWRNRSLQEWLVARMLQKAREESWEGAVSRHLAFYRRVLSVGRSSGR